MEELTLEELDMVNGGGLTLVELMLYSGTMALSTTLGGAMISAVVIFITEYQDYKDGV